VSPKLVTTTEEIDAYFQGIKTDTPRKITIGEYSTLILSDTAVVFAGFDVFARTKDGKVIETPARFTFVITKGDQGWRIIPSVKTCDSCCRAATPLRVGL